MTIFEQPRLHFRLTEPMHSHGALVGVGIVLSLLLCEPLSAQVVRGVVRAGDPPHPIANVEVQLFETERGGQWDAETDAAGRFIHSASLSSVGIARSMADFRCLRA